MKDQIGEYGRWSIDKPVSPVETDRVYPRILESHTNGEELIALVTDDEGHYVIAQYKEVNPIDGSKPYYKHTQAYCKKFSSDAFPPTEEGNCVEITHEQAAYVAYRNLLENGGFEAERPTLPSHIHREYSELDEIPEEVPIGASEADIELAGRAIRKAVRHHGHHDPTRRAMRKWYRDNDMVPDPVVDAARKLGPRNVNRGDVKTETQATAVLTWMKNEHSEELREAKIEYNEYLREKCEKALEKQREREADKEFAEDPPEAINGWHRFESDKPDVVVAYRANNYGTPSVAAVYETDDGLDAHETTVEWWGDAETAEDSDVNRHFVRLSNENQCVFGDLRSHLRTFDGEPLPVGESEEEIDGRPDSNGQSNLDMFA